MRDETGDRQGTLFSEKDGHGNKLLDHKNEMSDVLFNGWRRVFVHNITEQQRRDTVRQQAAGAFDRKVTRFQCNAGRVTFMLCFLFFMARVRALGSRV